MTVSASTSATPLVCLFPVILSQAKRKTQFVLGFDQVRRGWHNVHPTEHIAARNERQAFFLKLSHSAFKDLVPASGKQGMLANFDGRVVALPMKLRDILRFRDEF